MDCEGPTALYRHFDDQHQLLYVGISLSAIARLGQHQKHAHWFNRIRTVEIEWHPTRREAEKAEVLAIKEERPLFNIKGRVDDYIPQNLDRGFRARANLYVMSYIDRDYLDEMTRVVGKNSRVISEMIVDGLLPIKLKNPRAKYRPATYVQDMIKMGMVIQ